MKNFFKIVISGGLTCFLLFVIVDYMGSRYEFTLPYSLAEKKIGPAPTPSAQELVELGYPEEVPGRDYSQNSSASILLSLDRAIFMRDYRKPWQQKVDDLAGKYIYAFRALASVFLIGFFWFFCKAVKRWWVISVRPVGQALIIARLLPVDALGDGKSLLGLIGEVCKQRRLKKQHENFQQLESLFKSGLITQEQFETKRMMIASKIQKNM